MPPRRMRTSILRAPASMEFSTSSLITLAGRSTTSPAATWLATASERRAIRDTVKEEWKGKVNGGASLVTFHLHFPLIPLKHDSRHRSGDPAASGPRQRA